MYDGSSLSPPSAVNVDKDSRSRKRKKEPSPNGIAAVMKSIIDLCNNNETTSNIGIHLTMFIIFINQLV